MFSELISRKITFQLQKIFFRELISGKIAYHVVCDSENYMEKLFDNYSLGKSHFSYTKECFRNSFRNHFWLECIATSIARYEEYRCWASKLKPHFSGLLLWYPALYRSIEGAECNAYSASLRVLEVGNA